MNIKDEQELIRSFNIAKFIFNMKQSHGFPTELTFDILEEKGMQFNKHWVMYYLNKLEEEHSNISRKSANKKFHVHMKK